MCVKNEACLIIVGTWGSIDFWAPPFWLDKGMSDKTKSGTSDKISIEATVHFSSLSKLVESILLLRLEASGFFSWFFLLLGFPLKTVAITSLSTSSNIPKAIRADSKLCPLLQSGFFKHHLKPHLHIIGQCYALIKIHNLAQIHLTYQYYVVAD